jgi:hypothetical protein
MLVLLLRPLRDAVTFCILEKTREPTTAEERFLVQIGWRDKGARISENWLRGFKKQALICASRKAKTRKPIVRVPHDYLPLIHFASARFNFDSFFPL